MSNVNQILNRKKAAKNEYVKGFFFSSRIFNQEHRYWIMGDPLVAVPAALNMSATKVNLPAPACFVLVVLISTTAIQPLNNHRFTYEAVKSADGLETEEKTRLCNEFGGCLI